MVFGGEEGIEGEVETGFMNDRGMYTSIIYRIQLNSTGDDDSALVEVHSIRHGGLRVGTGGFCRLLSTC